MTAGNANNQGQAARTLSVFINRSPADVYAFAAEPENLPLWAKGLARSVSETDAGWVVETPQGAAAFRFAEKNDFGVLDHYVSPAPGVEIYVPMRVVENGAGSEVLFTLFRQPEMTDEKFAEDIALVEKDLQNLKEVLETRARG